MLCSTHLHNKQPLHFLTEELRKFTGSCQYFMKKVNWFIHYCSDFRYESNGIFVLAQIFIQPGSYRKIQSTEKITKVVEIESTIL